jgi:hypothetical protein
LKYQFINHCKPVHLLSGFYGITTITGIVYRIING